MEIKNLLTPNSDLMPNNFLYLQINFNDDISNASIAMDFGSIDIMNAAGKVAYILDTEIREISDDNHSLTIQISDMTDPMIFNEISSCHSCDFDLDKSQITMGKVHAEFYYGGDVDIAPISAQLVCNINGEIVTIPASPQGFTMVEKRSWWAQQSVNAFNEVTDNELGFEMDTVIQDLLCNLRHLCDQAGFNFDHLNEVAGWTYEGEIQEEISLTE